jgi:tripartite-type tricarboxylate transporter receptor subunit TctC
VASKDSGIKSLADLIKLARAKPGQIAIGSYGVGTPPHLAIELLKMRMGIDVIHIPYNGSAPAMIDLRGGRIPVLMDFLPSQVKTINDQEVVGLAIGRDKRSDLVPGVPTFDQAGLAGLEITTFFGLAGPVGIPKEIVMRINEAAARALSDPALQKSMTARGLTLSHSTAEGFENALIKETAQAKQIIQSAGIKSLD